MLNIKMTVLVIALNSTRLCYFSSQKVFWGSLKYYLGRVNIVKTWDELENWFKPLARGVVADVGAYIGSYTVRTCKSADLVVVIGPLPFNFSVLQSS